MTATIHSPTPEPGSRPPHSPGAGEFALYADIEVRVLEDPPDNEIALVFDAIEKAGVEVDPGGDVHLGRSLELGEGARLRWTLVSDTYGIGGIRIGTSIEDAEAHPSVTDTAGEYYPGTSFIVSRESTEGRAVKTLILTKVLTEGHLNEPGYYVYLLSLVGGGSERWIDPRIYNDGGGGPPSEPGRGE